MTDNDGSEFEFETRTSFKRKTVEKTSTNAEEKEK